MPTGVGKSYLACALAQAVIDHVADTLNRST